MKFWGVPTDLSPKPFIIDAFKNRNISYMF